MTRFCPLASGSKGNALYLESGHTKILIDAGISARRITLLLEEIGVDVGDLDAIVITHEHTDHIKGLAMLGCKRGIPVLANSDTARAIYEILGQAPKFKIFSTGERFVFGDLEFDPFSIQHDAVDPVGFRIVADRWTIGVCADLGFVTPIVKGKLASCDLLYIEANHQENMVHACARPAVYKERVLGRLGHLSNAQCAQLLAEIVHPKLQHIYLAHLSSECNNPELALKIIQEQLAAMQLPVAVSIAEQERASRLHVFDAELTLSQIGRTIPS